MEKKLDARVQELVDEYIINTQDCQHAKDNYGDNYNDSYYHDRYDDRYDDRCDDYTDQKYHDAT